MQEYLTLADRFEDGIIDWAGIAGWIVGAAQAGDQILFLTINDAGIEMLVKPKQEISK